MPQVLEGMVESKFPFLPDFVVAREREVFFPNEFGRFVGYKEWNDRCESAIKTLFSKAQKSLAAVKREVEERTTAQYIELKGEPAGVISSTEDEMERIVKEILPMVAAEEKFGWQRNSIYLRFGHRDFQKGTALSEVARIFGICTENTFAMGDSHNDLEMLDTDHSGIAACPANSVAAIQELIQKRGGLLTKSATGLGVVEALRSLFP